jgi:hypothetical protein
VSTTVNLDTVADLLAAASKSVDNLNGRRVQETSTPSARKATVAAVTRELLHLADQLDLAAALVKNEYWVGKGHEDLVFERDKPIGGTT